MVETAYNDQKNALTELITNAKKPQTTEGMSGVTVAQLQTAIQTLKLPAPTLTLLRRH